MVIRGRVAGEGARTWLWLDLAISGPQHCPITGRSKVCCAVGLGRNGWTFGEAPWARLLKEIRV